MQRPRSSFILSVGMILLTFAQNLQAQKPKEITNSIGMKLVLIPKGSFTRGSPPSEEGSHDDERQHEVTITKDYYLGSHEVTQDQYLKVMGVNPSKFQGDILAERHPKTGRVVMDVDSSNYPVETITWLDAREFCKRLSKLPEEKKAGRVFRLPTEAEWEYACRAGSQTAYSFGESPESLGDYSWYQGNSKNKSHTVGAKKPNAWGLYDMHGNVWELCSDLIADYPKGAVSDPTGPSQDHGISSVNHVIRGGCWDVTVAGCRSAKRERCDNAQFKVGFRVALEFSSPSEIPKKAKR